MPETFPIVGILKGVDKPGHDTFIPADAHDHEPHDRRRRVHVEGHELASLDMQRPHAEILLQILDQLKIHENIVHLQCERLTPDLLDIVDVAVPDVVFVRAISALPSGDLLISLPPLAATRVLRRSSPRFQDSLTQLVAALSAQAPVIVTDVNDQLEISHVATPASPDVDPFTRQPPLESEPSSTPTEQDIFDAATLVDRQRAHRLFLDMHALACDPGHVDHRCTPFAYVKDGCIERAHQMCEQLSFKGVVAAKVWLKTSRPLEELMLCPESPNIPGCVANWNSHVAPILKVKTPFGAEWRVVDPSLFDRCEPLPTIDEWRVRQRDLEATHRISEGAVFHVDLFFGAPDRRDPKFSLVPRRLAKYRAKLIRQVCKHGPPPYC